jgi:RNA polymerase sigma-70 factor, ECF subfamily
VHALRRLPDEPAPRLGDAEVAAFVRRHQKAIWRFLRALGCRPHDADELAQDALLIALARPHDNATAAAAFLRQTAKFVWLRRQRDDRRAAERLAAAADAIWRRYITDTDDGDAHVNALRACVDALPPRSRHVIARFYGEAASRAELAAELELGEHGVRTLLQRLRQALRACIERRRKP